MLRSLCVLLYVCMCVSLSLCQFRQTELDKYLLAPPEPYFGVFYLTPGIRYTHTQRERERERERER